MDRVAEARKAVDDFLRQRASGQESSAEEFISAHRALMPELGEQFRMLRMIERARVRAASATDSTRSYSKVPNGDGPPEPESNTDRRADAPATVNLPGYRIVRRIDRGGQGIVYEAIQEATKRRVAIKVMREGPFAGPRDRKRFKQEVQILAGLRHPHIVTIHESGMVAERCYYVMDFVQGVPLDVYVHRHGSSIDETLRLFVKICYAVNAAHRRSIIHRDLKPANIRVDADGEPAVLDFGLAKTTSGSAVGNAGPPAMTITGQFVGSLPWASPEQAEGTTATIDARTDVYSLGVILFQLLTRQFPYEVTGSIREVMENIVNAEPARPGSIQRNVNDEIGAIVLMALEKDPAARYQSAGEMGEDLQRYLRGDPVLAKRHSGLYRIRKKLGKHRRWAVVVGCAALATIWGLWSAAISQRREHARAREHALKFLQGNLESDRIADVTAGLRRLHDRNPYVPEVRLAYARALFRGPGGVSAISLLEEETLNDPACRQWHWAARILLAEFYRADGQLQRAAELERLAERSMPDTADAWYLRTFATYRPPSKRQEYFREVLGYVDRAVTLDPGHLLALNRLASLCFHTRDPARAEQVATRLIELGGNRRAANTLIAHTLAVRGRYEEARDLYTQLHAEEVQAESQSSTGALVYRVVMYRRLGEYDLALEDHNALIESQSSAANRLWCRYHRAATLWMLGRPGAAIADYEAFREGCLSASYADVRRYLILLDQGRRTDAREVLLNALVRVPDDRWLEAILRCLAGRITPGELITIAGNDRPRLCEAYYYAGELHLANDEQAQARGCFEKCLGTGVHLDRNPTLAYYGPMNEYDLAEWRLSRMAELSPAEAANED